MGDKMNLPDNMTEDDVLNIIRELCGDDMTDDELRNAYRTGMFQELCPDIEQYARQRHGGGSTVKVEGNNVKEQEVKIKTERDVDKGQSSHSKDKEEKKTEQIKSIKIKEEADSESSVSGKHSHHHHKKKKKKHSKDHKRRDKDRDERKDKVKSSEDKEKKSKSEHDVVNLADSSDSGNERRRKEERHKKEKKKKVIQILSSSDSDSDREVSKPKKEHSVKVMERKDSAEKSVDADIKPKVHPFYLDKSNEPGASQPSTSKTPQDTKTEKVPEKKIELRPFSKYSTHVSKTRLDKWRPALHKDHLKYQRKFRLKPTSVVCVDLLDFPMVFHHPRRHSKNPNAVPLSSGVHLSSTRLEMIRRLERDKANWFKSKINRRAMKFMKQGKHRRYDSSDDDRKHKRHRIMDRIISSSDTNSDSSSVMVPSKKARKDFNEHRERGGGKLTKAQKEAEAKRRKLEELKKKVDKFTSKGTRVLPWENKDAYFKNAKTKKDEAKDKEKLIAEKKKRLEQQRQEKLEQQKNAPSVSFQRILKQIETANKEQASKPKVELKIPKKTQNFDRPVPISEYKLDGKIGVGDVYKEVAKLLSRNVLVDCPVMPDANGDLGEYTVKKIAWWILKNEKDPALEGLYHPECHDDEEQESDHEDDFDWPSDVSSITGCVSDPEGTAAEVPPDPNKVADPDWADDYCGEASLYYKFRKETTDTKDKQYPIDSHEPFKSFLRVKPGTNYQKPNFEVKCFVCNEVLKGQRQYGAHIRSDSHKNNFRNYSLDMANYEEKLVCPPVRKIFVAKLVEYSTNSGQGNSTSERSGLSVEDNHQVGKIERERSDSPGPIVAGDGAPNIMVHQMPIPDDLSIVSYENYNISSDESLMNVRVALLTNEKWNDDLERRWRTLRDEQAKIENEYQGERDYFIGEPPRHPSFQEEWLKFWERRSAELEAEGIDTENYNFNKEWMNVWLTRMQEIMQERAEQRVAELKKRLGIDKHTLRARYGISAEATRRKKIKKKSRKGEDENSSSFKTSDQVDENGPSRKPMASTNHHQRYENNVHSKPACLPTPPITDEKRERGSSNNSNVSQTMSREKKSESRRDKHYKNHNDKHNSNDKSRHQREYHKSDKREHDIERRLKRKRDYSRSPDNSNSHSNSLIVKNDESVSSISSAEPSPPGEEPLLLGSSSKPGRPPPPVISEKFSNQVTELNKRIENELNEKLGSRNQSSIPELNSRKPHLKSDTSNHKNKEYTKSKSATSWSDNLSDEGRVKKRQRRNSGGSSGSSHSKILQSRLDELKAALAVEEGTTMKKNSTDRPKVIPLERSNTKRNLSDGEVASDISDFDMDPTKGVSTFVNKEIPGLADFDKPAPPLNLDKHSLGYQLLERKKSTDDYQSSNHSADRSKYDKRDDRHKSHHHREDKYKKSKGHSSKHEDRNRHKNDYRNSKDDRRKWDSSKDNRSHSRDRTNYKGEGSHHDRDFKQRTNNQPPYKNNHNRVPPPRSHPMEDSWEPEESRSPIPPPQPSRPVIEESWETEDSWDAVPPTSLLPLSSIPPLVPENTCHIPVLESVPRPPHQPYGNNGRQWNNNGGWTGNQNNYYNY